MFAEFLSDIEPFENVVESLEYITYKHNFSSNRRPNISIFDSKSRWWTTDEDGWTFLDGKPTNLPLIEISCCKDKADFFYILEINFKVCELTLPTGEVIDDSLIPSGEIMVNSRFYGFFRPTDYYGWKAPIAMLHEDIDTVARFATYYMKLYGYNNASDAIIFKSCDFTSGNPALAKFDDSLIIPDSLRRALFKLKDTYHPASGDSIILNFFSKYEYDNLIFPVCWIDYSSETLEIYTEWGFDEDTLDKHLLYHNRESLHIDCTCGNFSEHMSIKTDDVEFIMKSLMDYLMFLNPGIKTNDISVSLNFEWIVSSMVNDFNADYDWDADWRYNFYADGTESPREQFNKCFDLLIKYQKAWKTEIESYSNDKKAEVPKVKKGTTSKDEPFDAIVDMDEQERYFSTIPSAKINELLKYMPLKYNSLKLYDECSQSHYPVATICLANPYYVPYIEFEIQFYISNYDESKAKDVWLHKVKSSIKIDDLTTVVSLRVGDDIPTIAKLLTYYLRVLDIDISKLTPVWL